MSEIHDRIEAVFNEAVSLDSSEKREVFLNQACAGEPQLRAEVQELLRANERAGGFLSAAGNEPACAMAIWEVAPGGELPLPVIRNYTLLEKIGEGGFGVVYLAQQEEPVRRRVALKLIKPGMDSQQVVARFQMERQALAVMDHPHIAKVLDAGATASGRLYFVMEFVKGVAITRYCDEQKVPLYDRVHLFMKVCQAVQHAHLKGIIHRDLKPSNVLVAVPDGLPAPKIIDFGVAKATQQELTDRTTASHLHPFLGTPSYMSPEQADLSSGDIDTRTDIYSLGVLLYQLLTGVPPFETRELMSAGLEGMRRIIRERNPVRPSTKLIQKAPGKVVNPQPSQIAVPSARIHADLDAIVLKCLEKDRGRRYETANALVADLQRHLAHEPILARPASGCYRFGKWIQRRRTIAAALAVVSLTVVAGTAVCLSALLRERAARADERVIRGHLEGQRKAALEFIETVLTKVGPQIAPLAGAAGVQEILGEAGLQLAHEMQRHAANDAAVSLAVVRQLIAASQAHHPGFANSAGRYEAGLLHAQEAVALLESQWNTLPSPERSKLRVWAKSGVAYSLFGLGQWDEGLAHVTALQELLGELATNPELKSWAENTSTSLHLDAASAVINAGRPQQAIEHYLRPFVDSERARRIGRGSGETELVWLLCAYDNLTMAHAFQREFEPMLHSANRAVELAELLVARSPRNTRYVVGRPFSWAQQGYALVRNGQSSSGLALLEKARQESERLIQVDPRNDLAQSMGAMVAANQTLALAALSREAARPVSERERSLEQAEALLAGAEQLNQAAQSRETETFLAAARCEAAAARIQITTSTPPAPGPQDDDPAREHPPPAP